MKNNLLKTIALALSFSLLGQSFALAQTVDEQHPSLQDVQAQAKQDRNDLAKTKNNKALLAALGGYSVLSTAAVVKLAVDKAHQKTAQNKLTNEIKKFQQENDQLYNAYRQFGHQTNYQKYQLEKSQATIAQQEQTIAELKQSARRDSKKIEGLTISREKQIAKRTAAEQQLAAAKKQMVDLEQVYELRLQTLEDALRQAYSFLDRATFESLAVEANLDKYAALFDKEISSAERTALRASLPEEAWFKAFSKEEQKDFLKVIDEMILHTKSSISREGALFIFSHRFNQHFTPRIGESARYMLGLGRRALTKSGLFILAAGLVLPSIMANAQPAGNLAMANRISGNFELFLDATPEQLQQWNEDPAVYEACVQGAAVLHAVTLLDPQERQELDALVQQPAKVSSRSLHTVKAH